MADIVETIADCLLEDHMSLMQENANLRNLLGRCYSKLMKFGVENSDPLLMDELKLTLMQGPQAK